MADLRKRYERLRIACLLWAFLLIALSLQPERVQLFFLPNHIYQMSAHIAAYAAFTFLLCLWLRFRRSFFGFRPGDPVVQVIAFLLAMLWGGAVELSQLFTPDRYADWLDVLCNGAGALAGCLFFPVFRVLSRHITIFRWGGDGVHSGKGGAE